MNKTLSEIFRSVVVHLEFDHRLQSLIGLRRTSIELTEGTPFIMLLQAVLDSYPDITDNYDFRALGFEVNGQTPKPHFLLSANDIITLGIQSEQGSIDEPDGYYYQ